MSKFGRRSGGVELRFRLRFSAPGGRGEMMNRRNSLLCKVEIRFAKFARKVPVAAGFLLACATAPLLAQKVAAHDPAEPPNGKPQAKIPARPAGRIVRQT